MLDAEDRAPARRHARQASTTGPPTSSARRYGLVDGRQHKLADIGAMHGISAERVRQIERHAITKLRGDSEAA